MNGQQPQAKSQKGDSKGLVLLVALLVAVLTVIFHQSLEKNFLLFANDGQLGTMKAEGAQLPQGFSGYWAGLYWVGFAGSSSSINISNVISSVLSAEMWLKVYAAVTMFLLGFSAWLLFRQLKFSPFVCIIGGLAAALNMHFFSVACWGMGGWNVSSASFFLALAALTTTSIRQPWARVALAGFAVGNVVMEGADVGAFLSIYAGVFVVFMVLAEEVSFGRKVLNLTWKPAVVVGFAMWMAIHTVSGLIATQITGIAGTGQTQEDKARKWDSCTQWSLPKLETFRLIIPGIFGYRMDGYIHGDDKSSVYWGRIAQDPLIERIDSDDPEVRRGVWRDLGLSTEYPQQYEDLFAGSDPKPRYKIADNLKNGLQQKGMQRRHSGSGEYVGILVAVLALFGLANAFRGGKGAFSTSERRMIFFWSGVVVVSLLLAFGRHGFLYQYFYQLPYVSTTRNTCKFLFPLHIALIILGGYGLEALSRGFLEKANGKKLSFGEHLRGWWAKVSGFEKKWTVGSMLVMGGVVLATLIVGSSRTDLEGYLQHQGFDPVWSTQIVGFFFGELRLFIVFLAGALGLVICILSGAWNGARAKWAYLFLGTFMVLDLGRADVPWIEYYDVSKRYVSNPVVDFLKEKPYEHRVTAELRPLSRITMTKEGNLWPAYYDMLQNHLPYWNIQALDIIQMPREPEFDKAFMQALAPKTDVLPCLRLWQLTNTRYVLGSFDNPVEGLKFSPKEGFIPRLFFEVAPKPWADREHLLYEDLTFVETKSGPFVLFEYTNALPRAKLYADWQSRTNDQETLKELASPAFDPLKTVLIAAETPVAATPAKPDSDPGTVAITSYHPKRIMLKAEAKSPAVLLFNDKTDPSWKAWVDGKPVEVLRCNYIMRGVFLTQGEHVVEFRFQPVITTFYINLSAWGAGILLAGYLIITNRKRPAAPVEKRVKVAGNK